MPDSASPSIDRRFRRGWQFGLLAAIGVVVWGEWERNASLTDVSWLFDMNIDSTPYALLLLLLPICWIARHPILSHTPRWWTSLRRWSQSNPRDARLDAAQRRQERSRACGVVLLLSAITFAHAEHLAATRVGMPAVAYGSLPPAFHDEFSYVFQAVTIRTGTWSEPSHPEASRLFDQMHVLNEGRFASRYFPGTGIWLAAWSWLGCSPLTAMHLAWAFVTALVFLIGRELTNHGVGVVAALFTSFAPGMGLFGNLVLAHLPTLVGLGLFGWAFFRCQRELMKTASIATAMWASLAGCGLSLAMLCRPMTAAGFGLPFGMWIAHWIVLRRAYRTDPRRVVQVITGFAMPLACGLALIAWQNQSITGSMMKTPYGLYTELFTPRHMYGFNNVVRAEPLLTERVLDHYDRWAENLTPALAMQNVASRWLASWLWTGGLVVFCLSTPIFIAAFVTRRAGANGTTLRWELILASILSLHVVHIPYWYDGIFHYHYVFESTPLWCLILAESSRLALAGFEQMKKPWMSCWWCLVMVCSVAVNQIALSPFWSMSRVEAGLRELSFAKLKHAEFQSVVQQGVVSRPAIVLVKHDPSDRHIDYVNNRPQLDGPVLIGRLPAVGLSDVDTLRLAQRAFPERALYVWDVAARRLQRLR